MPDHVLGDVDVDVGLAVVDLEAQADEAGEHGGGAGLCADRLDGLAGGGADDGETVAVRILLFLRIGGEGKGRVLVVILLRDDVRTCCALVSTVHLERLTYVGSYVEGQLGIGREVRGRGRTLPHRSAF